MAKVTTGPIHQVQCPHCGHKLDFRELLLSGGETTVYAGAEISCEACNMCSVVARVQPITFVTLRPIAKRAPVEPPPGTMVRR